MLGLQLSPVIDPWLLLLPLVGLALNRRRKKGGERDESLPETYHILVDASFDGVMVLSSEGHMKWADDNFLDLSGYSGDEILDQHFTSIIDPGDAEKVQQYLTQAVVEAQNFSVRAIDREGSVQVYQVSAIGSDSEDGTEIIIGVRDITEEESVRRRIAFAEKMDLLSRVMTSIGRDLGPIIETLGPLAEMGEDPEIEEMLCHLSDLEKRIELFPRRGIRDGTEISIPELLEQTAEEVRIAAGPHAVDLGFDIDPSPYPVFGDSGQLTEAIRNVITNAVQAAGDTRGEVTVSCSAHSVDRATPRRGYILPPGEYVHITIADTGPGMPIEILEHAFEPLFSTRPGSPLAGLGLAVTYTVVKNHRGYIDMESIVGEGTSVDIFLPRSRVRGRRVVEAAAEAPVEEPPVEEIAEAPIEGPAAAAAVEAASGEAWEAIPAIPEPPAAEADAGAAGAVEEAPEAAEPELKTEAAVEVAAAEIEVVTAAEAGAAAGIEAEEAAAVGSAAAEVEAEEAESEEEEEALNAGEIASLSGHETILIIEEDGEIRGRIEEILEQFGYSALPARNWVEGVDLFKRHGHIIDLVLLNVMVPEMVWVKTLMDLRRAAVDARIGLMGSGEASATMQRYLDMPGISMLAKPVTTAGLMRGVRSSLDAKSS